MFRSFSTAVVCVCVCFQRESSKLFSSSFFLGGGGGTGGGGGGRGRFHIYFVDQPLHSFLLFWTVWTHHFLKIRFAIHSCINIAKWRTEIAWLFAEKNYFRYNEVSTHIKLSNSDDQVSAYV